jgi:excisionase family DNA binding protein
MTQGNLMTVRQASEQLGLHESTIRKWILSRKVGACKIGRAVRIPASSVTRLIEQGYRPAASEF